MAGSNLILKTNQVLFKEGDPADGMYVIRKGELIVYLEKNDNEVRLASIGTGGMIGEMAFFDKKPRSASVKATADTEVTKISEDDFAKLMKQIPKWFVGIMSALSTRLRETNDRLQKLENKAAGAKTPFEDTIRILHVLILIWNKEGVKEGKNTVLKREIAEKTIIEIFALDRAWVKNLFDTLVKLKFFTETLDTYKIPHLATSNKAALSQLAGFMRGFLTENPSAKALPDDALEMLETLTAMAKATPYDNVVVNIDELINDGTNKGFVTEKWAEHINQFFKSPQPAITLTKGSNGPALKVSKEELPKLTDNHRLLAALAKAGLA